MCGTEWCGHGEGYCHWLSSGSNGAIQKGLVQKLYYLVKPTNQGIQDLMVSGGGGDWARDDEGEDCLRVDCLPFGVKCCSVCEV